MPFPYLSSTPPEIREYIQTSGSLPNPWASNPSVVLTEPHGNFFPGGSLIILRRVMAIQEAIPYLSPTYRSLPQREVMAFVVNALFVTVFVSEE